jgi:hypothetical protein
MTGQFQRSQARFATIALIAVSTAAALVFGAAPARADEEIDFRIVFRGADQGCRTGSNKLITGPADPFLIEACAVEDGDRLPDRTLTAVVTHADGTSEEIVVTTGTDGSIRFKVVPVAAGLTTVSMCNDDGCGRGVVEFEASDPPSPPLIASYVGLTDDMGESAYVIDGEDDFDDPYTGGPAAPGSGDPAMDIKSFRYLGNADGVARFEITTHGDIFSLFSSGLPMVQVSMAVTTPRDARYLITYRVSSGSVDTYAESDGARLEGVVVEIEEGSLILLVTGVDVVAGSTMQASTWLIADEAGSGFQDYAEGTAVPAVVEGVEDDPATTETETPGTATSDDATEPPETATSDSATDSAGTAADGTSDGGLLLWVLIALLLAALVGGGYAYTQKRTKPQSPAPPSPAPTSDPEGPRTYSAEDRAALQEVYKGADAAGLKVVGISEITRVEDVMAGSKDNPVVIGKATTIEVGVAADGSLVTPDDSAAASTLSVEVIPSVEFDSKGDEHVVWSAYTREIDGATRGLTTTRSGPSADEWKAKVDGRSDAEIGNDPKFKDWVIETTSDNPADAVRIALSKR